MIATFQRPDNRSHCSRGWVPLAWGVEIEVLDEQGPLVQLQVRKNTDVKIGCRVLLIENGTTRPLLVCGVNGEERGPWLLSCVKE
jgi:hypothetical protein